MQERECIIRPTMYKCEFTWKEKLELLMLVDFKIDTLHKKIELFEKAGIHATQYKRELDLLENLKQKLEGAECE